jgi:ABC-type glycerol-3-phosphate transport system substrate-binding protein
MHGTEGFGRRVLLGGAVAAAMGAPRLARAAGTDEITWLVTDPSKPIATQFAAEFEQQNPGLKIRLQFAPYADLENKVLIALRSGSPPDIMEVQTSWIPSYAGTNKLNDLQPLLSEIGLSTSAFLPAAIRAASVGDKVLGIPYQAEALSIIYNKQSFREAGLDPDKPPQTWPELVETTRKLTRRGPDGAMRYGYGIAGGGPGGQSNVIYRALPYVWMNGGDILDADLKRSVLNSKDSVEGVKFYADFYRTLKVSPPSTLENGALELRRLFQAGAIAMYQATPTDFDLLSANPNLDTGVMVTPHPEGKASSALLGGWAFISPSDGKNKVGTFKLLRYLATREHIGAYTKTFPALTASLDLPRFSRPALKPFAEQLSLARAQPPIPAWVRMTDVFYQRLQEVLIGDRTPQAAMDAAAAEINKILA